ncbi:MAG: hypothetical protein ACFFEM_09310, partial [Candidatus Thorarchaeota archaeon]
MVWRMLSEDEIDTPIRYSMIPVLKLARIVLILSAVALNIEFLIWQMQQYPGYSPYSTLLFLGSALSIVLVFDIHAIVKFSRSPSSFKVSLFFAIPLVFSYIIEQMAIFVPLEYMYRPPITIILAHLYLLLGCVLVEGIIHLEASTKTPSAESRSTYEVRDPNYSGPSWSTRTIQAAILMAVGYFLYSYFYYSVVISLGIMIMGFILFLIGFLLILKERWRDGRISKMLQIHNQMLSEEMKRQRE